MNNTTEIPKDSPYAPPPEVISVKLEEDITYSKEARDKLESNISKLLSQHPLYGVVFLFLNKIQDRKMNTMGVGITRRIDMALYYNPEFVLSLSNLELRGVLKHEALHILLHHILRRFHRGSHPYIDNLASDMAINSHLTDIPDWAIFPNHAPFNFPEHQATEWYYESMLKNPNEYFDTKDNKLRIKYPGSGKPGKSKNPGSGDPSDSDSPSEGGDPTNPVSDEYKESGLIGEHGRWDECEEDIIDKKLRNIASEAIKAQAAKGWSSIGTDLAKQIIEANKPVVNWKKEIRYFINKFIKIGKNKTHSRINRREQSLKKYRPPSLKEISFNPGVTKDYQSRILVAIDTSGSVSDPEISLFLGEINGMYTLAHIDVILFDTQVCSQPTHISKKITKFDIAGRGGTDFTPALRFAEKNHYDGVICLSDGIFPIPTRENLSLRVLWCFTQERDIPPYGKLVKIDLSKR